MNYLKLSVSLLPQMIFKCAMPTFSLIAAMMVIELPRELGIFSTISFLSQARLGTSHWWKLLSST